MVWFTIALLLAVSAGLLLGRRPFAEMQSLVVGGRTGPGCVVAEAAGLVLVALVIYLLRRAF